MKPQNPDVVDIALSRLWAGEPASAILADFSAESRDLGPLLETAAAIEAIQPVEMPSREAFLADRNRFLASAASLSLPTSSPGLLSGFKSWTSNFFSGHPLDWVFPGGLYRRMVASVLMAALVLVLLVGTLGGTVVVAAESLPGSALYPLKLTMEQVHLAIVTEPEKRATVYLTQAQERIREVTELASRGEPPDEEILAAAKFRFNKAFEFASQTPDTVMSGLLIEIRQTAQTQAEVLSQIKIQGSGPAATTLRQAEDLLIEVRQSAETGLEDPQTFRSKFSGGGLPGCPPNTPCNGSCDDGNCQQSRPKKPDTKLEEPTAENECGKGDCVESRTRVPVHEQLRPDDGCGPSGCDRVQTPESAPTEPKTDDGCGQGRCSETNTPESVEKRGLAEDSCGQVGCQSGPTREPAQTTPQAGSSCDQDDCQPSSPQEPGQEQVEPSYGLTPTPTVPPTPEPTSSPDPASNNLDDGDGNDGRGSSDSHDSSGGGGAGSGGGSGSSSDSGGGRSGKSK
jgi:uncharacterized membrane protein YgcG